MHLGYEIHPHPMKKATAQDMRDGPAYPIW